VNKDYKSVLNKIDNSHPQELVSLINENPLYDCVQKIKDGKVVFQLFKKHERKDYSFTRFCGEFNVFQLRNLVKHLSKYKKYF